MKKFLSFFLLVAVLAACNPPKEAKTNYQLPDVADVVMYQVNPRVFAPENSLKVVAQRVDSISQLVDIQALSFQKRMSVICLPLPVITPQ